MNEKTLGNNDMACKHYCAYANRGNGGRCQYGGNRRYNYGFVFGTASYCYKSKKWLANLDIMKCPQENTDEQILTDSTGITRDERNNLG